ncbi:MAG: Na+/H+ antiporter [Candidatus Eremiobacteraeota bacterium]|nr:Na+/H+ antiporter [Candidatus Eremiobacteraeota bacterium]MCW5867149.1 Na+/H+ antiporter [Candidatus Eremiobacteraeota bacterium]
MAVAHAVLWMLLAVAVSDMVERTAPFRFPLPFIQILFGVLLDLAGISMHLPFSPELFFLVFLAPLLFADAERMPRRELFALRRTIVGLAVGLVAVTVVGMGYFVDWLAPSIPVAVCCALGAVLAPTDAVAVSALAGSLGMPTRLMHLLRGEALLNDASGVMALHLAVAAAASGRFDTGQAVLSFLSLSLGGLAIGAVVGWLSAKIGSWLSSRNYEDPSGQALLSLSIPFVAFALAEQVHVSGILAAVGAGVAFNAFGLTKERDTLLRLHARGVWRTIEFTLNGLIFVLLGLELPQRLGHVPEGLNFSQVFYFPLAILGMLYLTRLVWCWVSVRLTMREVSWRILAAMSLAGVRGTVSLAAVLSLPSELPGRDAVIFLATAVILLTLFFAAVGLPLILRGLDSPPLDRFEREERAAREALLKEAERALAEEMERLREEEGDSVEFIGNRLREIYQYRLSKLADRPVDELGPGREHRLEKQLRKAALMAQRKLLYALLKRGEINDSTLTRLERELDLQQASLETPDKGVPQLH